MKNSKMRLKHIRSKFKIRPRNSKVPVKMSDAKIVPKKLFKYKFFILCVVVPNVLFFIYMLAVQSKRYEVYAEIVLKDNAKSQTPTNFIPLVGMGGNDVQELEMIKRFIFSYEFLRKMDKEFDVKKYYKKDKSIDFISP